MKFTNIWSGETWCEKNASSIYAPFDGCQLRGMSLDNFRLDIYRPPAGEQIICSVKTYSEHPPADEIRMACGAEITGRWQAGELELRLIRSIEPDAPRLPPEPLPGGGLLDLPADHNDLISNEPYHLLARRVRDPLAWQNRYDAEIYAAAKRWNVPPKLLKRLIAAETQFYPATGADGELGLVQLTEGGIDLMLLYTMPGYAMQTPARRRVLRGEIILQLACDACNDQARAEAARDDFDIYARALAAYYLCYGSWDAALTAWNIKHSEMITPG